MVPPPASTAALGDRLCNSLRGERVHNSHRASERASERVHTTGSCGGVRQLQRQQQLVRPSYTSTQSGLGISPPLPGDKRQSTPSKRMTRVWGVCVVCVGYCTCWPRFGCKKLIFFPCLPSWECTPPFPYLPPLSKRDQRSGKVKVQTQTQRQPKSCSVDSSLESTTANLLAPKLTWTLGPQCCLLPIVGNTFLYVICYQQQFVLPPCNPPCATLFKAHLIANINISFPNASLSLSLSIFKLGSIPRWGVNNVGWVQ